jgi:hypothetical protein
MTKPVTRVARTGNSHQKKPDTTEHHSTDFPIVLKHFPILLKHTV